jgi:hypothetical protein
LLCQLVGDVGLSLATVGEDIGERHLLAHAEETRRGQEHDEGVQDRASTDRRHVIDAEGDGAGRFAVWGVNQANSAAVGEEADRDLAVPQQAVELGRGWVLPGAGDLLQTGGWCCGSGCPPSSRRSSARALLWIFEFAPITSYAIGRRTYEVRPIKLVLAALMLLFARAELSKRVKAASLDPKYLPLGGIVSGFFGGLSGHQGAFRSVFLLRTGLDKEAFIGTGAAIASIIALSRLVVWIGGGAGRAA